MTQIKLQMTLELDQQEWLLFLNCQKTRKSHFLVAPQSDAAEPFGL